MKYIASREFQIVSNALNFSTLDSHIIGNCDLYTTKAAGSDKRLYKNIENTLESQHESLVKLSASLSPQQSAVSSRGRKRAPAMILPDVDLSRDSPFGPLSQISARRTFAYLIATLNASHPDYDFSNTLRPSDFQKTSATMIKREVDSMMVHLRPRRMPSFPSAHRVSSSAPPAAVADVGWGDHMWVMIDREMSLRGCEKYVWKPEDDPFEEEGHLWSQHYFFFSKEKKRVCYLHFGAFSVVSHSPLQVSSGHRARSLPKDDVTVEDGAEKRARYWLGRSVDAGEVDSMWNEDDESEGEYTDDVDDIREHLDNGYLESSDEEVDLDTGPASAWSNGSAIKPRAHSEDAADAMEM